MKWPKVKPMLPRLSSYWFPSLKMWDKKKFRVNQIPAIFPTVSLNYTWCTDIFFSILYKTWFIMLSWWLGEWTITTCWIQIKSNRRILDWKNNCMCCQYILMGNDCLGKLQYANYLACNQHVLLHTYSTS